MSNQTPNDDRTKDLKAFDERKTGVKGLLDEPTDEIQVPNIFIRPVEDRSNDLPTCPENISIPIIDLAHVNQKDSLSKSEIVKQMLRASGEWGFFQVVNHGIPIEILNKMIETTRMFHEQDNEVKKKFYTRDNSKVVAYNTNYDLYKSNAANWRDTLSVSTFVTGKLDPQDLPSICREAMLEYLNHTLKLGDLILELLSLSLGLQQDYLSNERSNKEAFTFVCHYYPSCPKPELTLGTSKHTDSSFITLLLQDHIGGLQVLHDNQWVNVKPCPGALIVNIGDLLQIISNDKLKSVTHRVIAQNVGPRVSIALFLRSLVSSQKKYGPIKDLLSEENQPIYKDFTIEEFFTYFFSRPVDQSGLDYFKL